MEAPGIAEAWPEAVRRVSAALREAGAEARIEEFPADASTAEDAAGAVGCDLRQIVKSLVFDCDGKAVLVLVPGNRRADPTRVAELTGAARARIAGPAEVEEATGFAPGGVAPFPLRAVESVLIENSLLGEPLVWVGAGSSRHMVGLPPTELVRVSRAQAGRVANDDYHS